MQDCTEEKKRLSIIWNAFSVLKKRTEKMERYTQLITLCTDKVDKNIFGVPCDLFSFKFSKTTGKTGSLYADSQSIV